MADAIAVPVKTLTAYYDLAIGPVSFDVIPFLISARMAAEDAGCESLHVVLVPDPKGIGGMFRDKTNLYDEAEMHWRLWNLVMPSCQLIGASVTLATAWEQAERLATSDVFPKDWHRQTLKNKPYLARPIVDAARAGRKIPRLRSSEHARRCVRAWYSKLGKPVATITERNTYETSRNLCADTRVAALTFMLQPRYVPIVIGETLDELTRGKGYAGINLDLRMACYEEAALNIIGNTGPSVLLWYSNAAWIQFDAARPLKDWQTFWETHYGLDVRKGEQLPWAAENQRLVYGPAEHIRFDMAVIG